MSAPTGTSKVNKSAEVNRQINRQSNHQASTYDRLSRWYDYFAYPFEKPCQMQGIKLLQPKLGEVILEIGCGTGNAVTELAKAVGQAGKVYGVDLSKGMLEKAQKRIAHNGFLTNVELGQYDARDLPYPNSFFDATFLSFTLELFSDHDICAVLRQCHRTVKPHGKIVVVSLLESYPPKVAERIYKWFHHRFPAMIDCRPINIEKYLEQLALRVVSFHKMPLCGLKVGIYLLSKV